MATSSIRTRPTRHPVGTMRLNKITRVKRERRLPASERDDRWSDPGEKYRHRQQEPQQRGVRADPHEQGRADDETHYRAGHGANRVLPGVQRVRAQHRQRAEDHPERVLDPGQPRGEHRQPQPGGTTQAVVQPDRVRLEVGRDPFPRRGQRPRHTLGLAAKPPLPPAAPLGSRGQLDVARDERDRVAQLLRTEGGVKRGDELADRLPARGRVARRLQGTGPAAQPSRLLQFRVRNSQFGQRGVELVAASAPGVEEIRGTFENLAAVGLDSSAARLTPSRWSPGWMTMLFSQFSSSTRRTVVLAGVLNPVGR